MNNDLERVTKLADAVGAAYSTDDESNTTRIFRNSQLVLLVRNVLAEHHKESAEKGTIAEASLDQEIESLQAKLAMQAENITKYVVVNEWDGRKWVELYDIEEALNATQADVDAFMAKKKSEIEKDVLEELRTRYQFAEGRLNLDLSSAMIKRGGVR